MGFITDRFVAVENEVHGVLVRHGIRALRLTVGAVFLGFGFLKLFPGVSPAQDLAIRTIDLLTLGLVPWHVGIVAIAILECFIGICLLANRWMRLAVWLLALELVGILAPVVLLTGRLFSGPHHAPTLEGQYVLKDIILVAAGMVIAAGTFRGGHLVRDAPQPGSGAVEPLVGSRDRQASIAAATPAPAGGATWRRRVRPPPLVPRAPLASPASSDAPERRDVARHGDATKVEYLRKRRRAGSGQCRGGRGVGSFVAALGERA